MPYGFGIDLGGTSVKLACFDAEGLLHKKWEIPTDVSDSGKNILPDISASIKAYCKQNALSDPDIIGIGIGVPGPVDKNGVVHSCVNLGWGMHNVAKELSSLTGFRVCVGNDANLAALGECWKGSAAGFENVVFITIGTGVGAGIVLDGKILFGAHGASGEIGFVLLNQNELQPHPSGLYGCAEQYCSATGLVRLASEHLQNTASSSCLRGSALTAKSVFDAASKADAEAIKILQKYYAQLGRLLASVCAVVDPALIVLGGGVSKAGEALTDGIRPYFEANALSAMRSTPIILASLGNDAGVFGAFKLALQQFLN